MNLNYFEILKRLEKTINQNFTCHVFVEEIKSKGDDCFLIHINGGPVFINNYKKCYSFLTLLCEGEKI